MISCVTEPRIWGRHWLPHLRRLLVLAPKVGRVSSVYALAFAGSVLLLCADKKPEQTVKPMAGPRATVLRTTTLYVSPDRDSQKVSRVEIGREMVVAEKSGPWMRVYANTDIEEQMDQKDTPWVGGDENTPPISGWIESKGVVEESTQDGDQILMGAAANQESEASDPRGPANAAQSAKNLYRRVAEMYPNSPLAPEAAWRAADIQWQIEKHDVSTLPSAHEKNAYEREQMDEDGLRKVVKNYPRTRWAAFAAYDLIDNKLCGDWQGSPQCPEKESDIYIKYADEYPDGPRTAQALYLAVYRLAVLNDMYSADGNDKKSGDARNEAHTVASQLKAHFGDSDYTRRAAALVYKLDQGVPVYGIELNGNNN
jgi:hypothetical protein